MLTLNLFGSGQALYDQQPLVGFPNQQYAHLFCYLLLHRTRPHNREHLAAIFWGDSPTDVSRKYLSQALWRLRQTFAAGGVDTADYLAITKETVAFVASAPYQLDTESFESTIDRYQQLADAQLTADVAHNLEKVVALYTGELLEGVYEDWCLSERERLHLLYLHALNRLLCYHTDHGNYAQGLLYGERILTQDNTREKVHRQIMRLYWLLGDRSAALGQYKRCTQILQDELGIPPMPETELLYRQMKHDQYVPAQLADAQAPASSSTSRPIDQSTDSMQLMTQGMLQKIAQLRSNLEHSSAELRQVEQMMHKLLHRVTER